MPTPLRNHLSRPELAAKLAQEKEPRTTLSFYRYVEISDPRALRDNLYAEWRNLGVLGRIYLVNEGINAQLSVPTRNLAAFRAALDARPYFKDMPFKIAVEDGISFLKLTIKVRKQIVADSLPEGSYDLNVRGTHLSPQKFNETIERGDAIVVDMRNQYESRIGAFEGAILPDADTFREELPMVRELLRGKEDKKVLLYCTGGIRCEKASSFLIAQGFKDVNQLSGGVINYAHEVSKKGIASKFKGRNFVFDDRLAERVTDDVLTTCDQCEMVCDEYTNCSNEMCNRLFIQCATCHEKFAGACTEACAAIARLPIEERRALRKTQPPKTHTQFTRRMRSPTQCVFL